jgi:hypothetical protein
VREKMSALIADWSAFAKRQQVVRMCRVLKLGGMGSEVTVNASATATARGAVAAIESAAGTGGQAWCDMTALDRL